MSKILRIFVLALVFVSYFSVANAAFRTGDQGEDILKIQNRLNDLGYSVVADGDYGSATAAAVRAFQADRGLDCDGIVGQATYRAMLGSEMPVSRSGSTSMVRGIIQNAYQYIGTPYVYGGTSPGGFDCSGFVRYVFANYGVYLPRTADAQYEVGRHVSSLQPGDLVFFSTDGYGVSHSGIYIGNNEFISATSSSGVRVDSLACGYWGRCYIGASRIL